MKNDVAKLLMKMFQENTGTHFLDSGGDSGRGYQRKAKLKLKDFMNKPDAEYDKGGEYVVVNTFGYLCKILELDKICNKFNKKFPVMSEWDSELFHNISFDANNYLENIGFSPATDLINTYNYETLLDETLLFSIIVFDNEIESGKRDKDEYYYFDNVYVLLQTHNGADVRGGYSNAKLFKFKDYLEIKAINSCPDVYGEVKKPDGTVIQVSTRYNGTSLTRDDDKNQGEKIEIGKTDIVNLFLGE